MMAYIVPSNNDMQGYIDTDQVLWYLHLFLLQATTQVWHLDTVIILAGVVGVSLSESHINGSAMQKIYVYILLCLYVWYDRHIPYICCSKIAKCNLLTQKRLDMTHTYIIVT